MDAVSEWAAGQQRVIELVSGLSPQGAATRVPACPDWTVRDLLSHMVGLGGDVVAGDEPDDHNAGWTARHVAQRRDRDVAALVDEWRSVAGPLQEYMRTRDVRPLADLAIHEQDLRGALRVPGGQDTDAIGWVRDRFAPRLAARVAALPPLALVGTRWRWASAGSVDDAPVALHASDFDLSRALVTRRSAAQLRSWTVRGDVGPYLPAFALLGPLPAGDLTES